MDSTDKKSPKLLICLGLLFLPRRLWTSADSVLVAWDALESCPPGRMNTGHGGFPLERLL